MIAILVSAMGTNEIGRVEIDADGDDVAKAPDVVKDENGNLYVPFNLANGTGSPPSFTYRLATVVEGVKP